MTHKKQVLIVNTSGLGVGGITSHMVNYISNINTEYEFTVVATIFHEQQVIDSLKSLGCQIISMANRKKQLLKYYNELKQLMASKQFDIIHVHGNSATMVIELQLAKKFGIPSRIAHCHNSLCSHKFLHMLLNPLFKQSYTLTIACSQQAGDWIFGPNNYTILKNGIQAANYQYNDSQRQHYRQLFNCSDETLLLGNVGNLVEQKNQEFLIPLIKELKSQRKVKLMIVGQGDKEEHLKSLIKQNNLQNEVKIFPYRDDIPACLQAFDALVMPSKWEGLPLILIEAQTAGLPCLVSDKITSDASISGDLCTYLPLSTEQWFKQLTNFKSNENRQLYASRTKKAGFDMEGCINQLRSIYG